MNQTLTRYLPVVLRNWLEARQQLQKTLGNTGWLLFDRILRMGIGLTIGAWVARYLGPSQFGELAYVISLIAFFQVITRLEADGFVVRDIAQKRGETCLVLGTALWLRLFFGACSWAFAVFFMFLLHPQNDRLILLTAIIGATLVFQASDTVDLWFQSQSQSRRTVIAKFVAYLFSNGLKVFLLLSKASLFAFAGVMCLEAAAITLGLAIAYRRFPTHNRWKASFGQARILLHQCWPFIASALMMTTYLRIDQIMLKEILGERELGIYAVSLPISQALTVIPATLVTSLAPYVAQRMHQSELSYQEIMVKIFRFFAIMALVVASLTALASPRIISLLYGSQYQSASLVLSIHVFANLFIYQGIAQSLWVVNNNVRAVIMISTFCSAVIGIVSSVLLIKEFGIPGAAFSVVITEGISAAIPCLLRKDLRHLYKRAFFLTQKNAGSY